MELFYIKSTRVKKKLPQKLMLQIFVFFFFLLFQICTFKMRYFTLFLKKKLVKIFP
jgi:hypothetical protein